jgi:hypothetical protein
MPLDIYWPDSHLDSVTIEYDSVRMVVSDDEGRRRVVVGTGPIGIEQIGLWDEVIIDSGHLSDDHPFAARCWSDIESRGQSQCDTGSPARNGRRFQTLEVTFQDGSALRVAAARFEVEGD